MAHLDPYFCRPMVPFITATHTYSTPSTNPMCYQEPPRQFHRMYAEIDDHHFDRSLLLDSLDGDELFREHIQSDSASDLGMIYPELEQMSFNMKSPFKNYADFSNGCDYTTNDPLSRKRRHSSTDDDIVDEILDLQQGPSLQENVLFDTQPVLKRRKSDSEVDDKEYLHSLLSFDAPDTSTRCETTASYHNDTPIAESSTTCERSQVYEYNPVTRSSCEVSSTQQSPTRVTSTTNLKIKSRKSRNDSEKPDYSYTQLNIMAITHSPGQKATSGQIYDWIESHFPYYCSTSLKWRNSIRHNLCNSKAFVKIPRDKDHPKEGRGSYWSLSAKGKSMYDKSDFILDYEKDN